MHYYTFRQGDSQSARTAATREVRLLGLRLLGMISLTLSLGLEEGYMEKALSEQEQQMAVNYYPQTAVPGTRPHLRSAQAHGSQHNALTNHHPPPGDQDPNVAGLQVLKGSDDQWIAVSPRPNAFVINLGDQLQVVISNAHVY